MRKAGRETHAQLKVCGRILISRPGSTTVCLPWLKPETALLLISCLFNGYTLQEVAEERGSTKLHLMSCVLRQLMHAYWKSKYGSVHYLTAPLRFCSLSHCSSTVLFTISLLLYGSVHYLTAPLRFCSLSHCSSTVLFTISLLAHLRFCSLSHCTSTVLFTISLLLYGSVHYLTAPLRFCSLSHCSSTVLFTISLLLYGSVHYLTAHLRFCSLSHRSSTVLFTISLLIYGSVHYLRLPCARPICFCV